MKSFKEYQERKEAKKFFKQNNSIYLSNDEWILLIIKGLFSAVVIGIIHGLINRVLLFDFSFIYIVVGIFIANVLSSSVNRATNQIGLLSVFFTLVAYYVCFVVLELSYFNLFVSLFNAFFMFVFNDLLTIIFMIIGLVAAYLQGSDNKFM